MPHFARHRRPHVSLAHSHGSNTLPRIWERGESITAYNAAYVTLAEALDAPFLTCDGKLARSHGHRAKIELIE
jgi:predicted nucleic acid-binding protein